MEAPESSFKRPIERDFRNDIKDKKRDLGRSLRRDEIKYKREELSDLRTKLCIFNEDYIDSVMGPIKKRYLISGLFKLLMYHWKLGDITVARPEYPPTHKAKKEMWKLIYDEKWHDLDLLCSSLNELLFREPHLIGRDLISILPNEVLFLILASSDNKAAKVVSQHWYEIMSIQKLDDWWDRLRVKNKHNITADYVNVSLYPLLLGRIDSLTFHFKTANKVPSHFVYLDVKITRHANQKRDVARGRNCVYDVHVHGEFPELSYFKEITQFFLSQLWAQYMIGGDEDNDINSESDDDDDDDEDKDNEMALDNESYIRNIEHNTHYELPANKLYDIWQHAIRDLATNGFNLETTVEYRIGKVDWNQLPMKELASGYANHVKRLKENIASDMQFFGIDQRMRSEAGDIANLILTTSRNPFYSDLKSEIVENSPSANMTIINNYAAEAFAIKVLLYIERTFDESRKISKLITQDNVSIQNQKLSEKPSIVIYTRFDHFLQLCNGSIRLLGPHSGMNLKELATQTRIDIEKFLDAE